MYLLNEMYPKGQILKMTLFSSIDLDKKMPKNPKNENRLKQKILCVKIRNLQMGIFLKNS